MYIQDIGMEFHIEKYTVLIMRSGKQQKRNQEKIRTL